MMFTKSQVRLKQDGYTSTALGWLKFIFCYKANTGKSLHFLFCFFLLGGMVTFSNNLCNKYFLLQNYLPIQTLPIQTFDLKERTTRTVYGLANADCMSRS